jgi:hypothetical protein
MSDVGDDGELEARSSGDTSVPCNEALAMLKA